MPENAVDIWLTNPEEVSGELLQAYVDLLDEDENERWRSFKTRSAGRQNLVARALVRTTLSRYVDIEPGAWRFASSLYGRPLIKHPPRTNLFFNVSHTDGLIACAVSREFDVGVDVEDISRSRKFYEIAADTLSVSEARSIFAASPEVHKELFLTYWTLKEAYAKARGIGLSVAFDSFSFDISERTPKIVFHDPRDDDTNRWTFHRCRPTHRHQLALAAACQPPLRLRLHWVVPLRFEIVP